MPQAAPTLDPTRTGTADDSGAGLPDCTDLDDVVTLEHGARVGRYLVLEPIGRGGMGTVYAAYDPELDRRVAIKIVSAGTAGTDRRRALRMVREAQAMARLDHPNVLTVHDVGTLQGGVYIAMELVEGTTLGRWARGREWREVAAACVQAGEGLLAAHRAGLVHRDFKPSNVLVDGRGRVRVLDFGLARASSELDGQVPDAVTRLADGKTPLAASLTVDGFAVGTPAYMPPEQFRGEAVDARADQFSFCVTAWELLLHRRPFAGDDLATIQRAIARGTLASPAPAAAVPSRVRAALVRGLRARPEERFASMEPLLQTLRSSVGSRRRWPFALGGAALLGLGASLLSTSAGPDDPCEGAAALTAPVWPDRREAVQKRWAQLVVPNAAQTFARVDARLAELVTDWNDTHREVCTATRVHHTQSEELHDRRMACLQTRLQAARTVADRFADADAQAIRRAPKTLDLLPSLAPCNDAEHLMRALPLPEDPRIAAEVIGVRGAIVEVTLLQNAHDTEAAGARLAELHARAEATGYAPLLVRIERMQARNHATAGDWSQARNEALTLVPAAARARDSSLVLDLWLDLLAAERRLGDLEAARHWLLAAEVAAQSPVVQPRRRAALHDHAASLLRDLGELTAAQARAERAVALYEAEAPGHHLYPRAVETLGGVLVRRGRTEAALVQMQRALELRQEIFGARHAQVGASHANLGVSLIEAGRAEEGLAQLRRSAEIFEEALGEDHPQVIAVKINIGSALTKLQRFEEALRPLGDAAARARARHGAAHRHTTAALTNLAIARFRLGHHAEALELQQQVVEAVRTRHDAPHDETARALDDLSQMQRDVGDAAAALASARDALEIRRVVFADDPPKQARAYFNVGAALLDLGRGAGARESLERALELAPPANALLFAETRYLLARALVAVGEDAGRARELAEAAIAAVPQAQAQRTSQMRAWVDAQTW